MAHAYDLVIRGGVVIDGTGAERREADVAVAGGRIAAIGDVSGRGAEEIDARGRLVTPGFVDIHTHYDGQAVWSDRLSPSSSHGVTTAVGGNCGVGFAPCRPEHRELLVSVMEGVEDIPEVVMTEGLSWDWQTYPEYLDAIAARPHDIDFASQIPHSAVRVYVMGQRGADREPATADDLAKMQGVVREAMDAGALGFATSRLVIHKTGQGDPIPTFQAAEAELEAMALALKDAGRGVLQAVFGAPGRSFEDEIDHGPVQREPRRLAPGDAASGRRQRRRPADPRPGLSAADRRGAGLRPDHQPVQPLPQLPAADEAVVRGANRRAARPAGARPPLDGGPRRGADPAGSARPALRIHVPAG
jgi:hypothetical protein